MWHAVATESAAGHRVVWQVSTRTDVYRMSSASMSAHLGPRKVCLCSFYGCPRGCVGQAVARRACVLEDTSQGSRRCHVYTH